MAARIGLALDIDGVFVRGGKVIAPALKALRKIHHYKIPHVFVTNGGGILEETRAKDLSAKFATPVLPSQILLSHTPMRKLAKLYADRRVLVIGSRGYLEVAKEYGFTHFVTPQQLHLQDPEAYPLRVPHPVAAESATTGSSGGSGSGVSNIAAAIILHDPVDWALEMQVLTDVLLGETHNSSCTSSGGKQQQTIPLHACNADVVYMDVHRHPRYTQGAFVAAFRGLFESYTGSPLQVDFCGKPFAVQYRTAEEMIRRYAAEVLQMGEEELPTVFYGIGDNPKADVRGANDAGGHWSSVLVRTGVFQGSGNDPDDTADIVADDVDAAVDHIIQTHYAHVAPPAGV